MSIQKVEMYVCGGIGNQLFQFASGLSLSSRLNAELVLDLSWYEKLKGSKNERKFALESFVDLAEVQILPPQFCPRTNYLNKICHGYKVVSDKSCAPIKLKTLETNRNIRMKGYWQSLDYFSSIAELLSESINRELSSAISDYEIISGVKDPNSLGIHVRRGDYVSDSKTKSFHGVCDIDYFNRAFDYVNQRRPVSNVFVFSDDIDWCVRNLQFPVARTIVSATYSDVDQIKLLSMCGNHVISNSSFSWWAAWLNSKENQIVVYPKNWFADGKSLEGMPYRWVAL